MIPDSITPSYGEFIDRTAKLIKIELGRKFKEADINITPEQWAVLSKLYKEVGLPQSKLGEATYKDAPTVSRIIDLLCKKGYTTRTPSPDDRRKYQVEITAEGNALVERALPIINETREKGWKGLKSDDYDLLMHLLNTINQNFI